MTRSEDDRRYRRTVRARTDALREHERCYRLGLSVPEWVTRCLTTGDDWPIWKRDTPAGVVVRVPWTAPTADDYEYFDALNLEWRRDAEDIKARRAAEDAEPIERIRELNKPDPMYDHAERDRLEAWALTFLEDA